MCPRKRSKQLISGPYHKVLSWSSCYVYVTSRSRFEELMSASSLPPGGCQSGQETGTAPSGEVVRNALAVATSPRVMRNCNAQLRDFYTGNARLWTTGVGRDANKLRSLYLSARSWRYCESKAKRMVRHACKKMRESLILRWVSLVDFKTMRSSWNIAKELDKHND